MFEVVNLLNSILPMIFYHISVSVDHSTYYIQIIIHIFVSVSKLNM